MEIATLIVTRFVQLLSRVSQICGYTPQLLHCGLNVGLVRSMTNSTSSPAPYMSPSSTSSSSSVSSRCLLAMQGKYFEAVCSEVDPDKQQLVACFPADTGMDEFCFKLDFDILILGESLPSSLHRRVLSSATRHQQLVISNSSLGTSNQQIAISNLASAVHR